MAADLTLTKMIRHALNIITCVNIQLFQLHTKFAAAFFAAAFVLLAGSAQTSGQTVIRVAGETSVEREQVLLGAVSTMDGPADATGRLSRISLGYAPAIGLMREIRRDQIVLAIRAAGFSENDVRIESPASIVIRRDGQNVPDELIRNAVEKEFLTRLASNRVEARITRLSFPPNIQVPKGELGATVNGSSVRNIFMPFSVPVEVRVNGRLVRSIPVTCEIEAYADVFTAAKDLPAGASVTERDLRREKTRIDRPINDYVRDPNSLRGVALTRGVWSGAALTGDSIASVAVIKPGDPIRIEAGSGRMRIIVNGEAKAAGRIGDRISVKNSQTGTILQATVIDKGIVRIGL
ncbi:MAG: flagellar basal body P-ring formation protein FlgA [Acidobacteria bacterium]|nr:flagellar basal body P-ring formation protein FlgA [Acidobacteriota bacterium]